MSNQNQMNRVVASLAVGVALVSGAFAGGCGRSTKVENRTTTTGQELQDLEEARNKGLLTEDEYNKKRQEIMKRK
jgi:hypothetical protein